MVTPPDDELDPEFAAIAVQLRETAAYAIDPTFIEALRKELLQQLKGLQRKRDDVSSGRLFLRSDHTDSKD
jgi:hypothetical protein